MKLYPMLIVLALALTPSASFAAEPEAEISAPHPCVENWEFFFMTDEGLRGFAVSDARADAVIAQWYPRYSVLFTHFPESERRSKMRAVVQSESPYHEYPENLRIKLRSLRVLSCSLLTGWSY